MTNMMFVCDTCNNVDSLRVSSSNHEGFKCYRCQHGHWHGLFPEETYDPYQHFVENRVNRNFNEHGEPSFG